MFVTSSIFFSVIWTVLRITSPKNIYFIFHFLLPSGKQTTEKLEHSYDTSIHIGMYSVRNFHNFQRSKWKNIKKLKYNTKSDFYKISDFLFFIGVLALSIILIFQLLFYLKSMIFFLLLDFSFIIPRPIFALLVCKNYGVENLLLSFSIDFPIPFFVSRGQDNYNSLNINKKIYNLIFNLLLWEINFAQYWEKNNTSVSHNAV